MLCVLPILQFDGSYKTSLQRTVKLNSHLITRATGSHESHVSVIAFEMENTGLSFFICCWYFESLDARGNVPCTMFWTGRGFSCSQSQLNGSAWQILVTESEQPMEKCLFLYGRQCKVQIQSLGREDPLAYPLQYSCLGNPTDGGAWWATVHRVTVLDMTEQPSSSKVQKIV